MEKERRLNPNIKLYPMYKDMVMKTAESLDISMSRLAESIFKDVLLNPSEHTFDGRLLHIAFKELLKQDFEDLKAELNRKMQFTSEKEYRAFVTEVYENVEHTLQDNQTLFENCETENDIIDVILEFHEDLVAIAYKAQLTDVMNTYMKKEKPEYLSGYQLFEQCFEDEFKLMLLELELARRATHAGITQQLDASLILFISKLVFEEGVILLMDNYRSVEKIQKVIDTYMEENPGSNPYLTIHKIVFEWEVKNKKEIRIDDHKEVRDFVENYLRESSQRYTYKELGEIITNIRTVLQEEEDVYGI